MLKDFLKGTRVLDLSQYLPGPFATRLLADMGADVVKVEPPSGDPLKNLDPEGKEGSSPFYEMINAGKTVITVDLKTDGGKTAFAALAARADVVLESFRPGVLDRLGFGEERLNDLNPRLIHCALSGYGQTGPYRLVSGHDIGYVSMTGGLNVSGPKEAPAITYPPMADHAGALQAALTILGALIARQRGGGGAFLDISLSESLLSWQGPGLTMPPARGEGVINGGTAFYQIYRTGDGRFISLSPLEPKFWANFCNAVGRPQWIVRQFEPMPQTALIGDVAALIAGHPLAHWEALLPAADCCYQAVLEYPEIVVHPHVEARGLVRSRDGITDVLFPAYVDGEPPEPRASLREADAETVLGEWSADTNLR
jgi:crotonobetainyl-CoA:carnitine CoA-transferase CaiB-like acyl-CoA transferase